MNPKTGRQSLRGEGADLPDLLQNSSVLDAEGIRDLDMELLLQIHGDLLGSLALHDPRVLREDIHR